MINSSSLRDRFIHFQLDVSFQKHCLPVSGIAHTTKKDYALPDNHPAL